MKLALSTHWNARRHRSGESMIDEILGLGVDRAELGYDLTLDLVSGVLARIREKAVTVDSVHNYCPVPVGAPAGHPEIFVFTSADARERESAVRHTTQTINFAKEAGARFVVVHAGRVDMSNLTSELIALCESGEKYSGRYEKIKLKLMMQRDKKARKHLDRLYEGLERLLPVLDSAGVRLALENLPTWEAIPSENEMLEICRRFNTPLIGCWHDMGHGQVREELGFIGHKHWVEKLSSCIAGFHVHDVAGPSADHLMPPRGKIDFAAFKKFIRSDTIVVLEPAPGTPAPDVKKGIEVIRQVWADSPE